jgi:hypothetical protein
LPSSATSKAAPGGGGGCGCLIVAEEAITELVHRTLVKLVAAQPPWSDLPLLILTGRGANSER